MGGPTSCQLYYYWARYGQYVVLVEMFATTTKGVDERVFEFVVSEIDHWVSLQLTRNNAYPKNLPPTLELGTAIY